MDFFIDEFPYIIIDRRFGLRKYTWIIGSTRQMPHNYLYVGQQKVISNDYNKDLGFSADIMAGSRQE